MAAGCRRAPSPKRSQKPKDGAGGARRPFGGHADRRRTAWETSESVTTGIGSHETEKFGHARRGRRVRPRGRRSGSEAERKRESRPRHHEGVGGEERHSAANETG